MQITNKFINNYCISIKLKIINLDKILNMCMISSM